MPGFHYQRTVVAARPTAAPEQFTVFQVDTDEYVFCPIRNRAYKVDSKPEEKVRQWWIYKLVEEYGYSFDQLGVEIGVRVGSTMAKKKADIVVYADSTKRQPRIFVEVKKPKRLDGIEQLQVYMNATGCRLGLWSNGTPPHTFLLRIEPREGEEQPTWRELRDIPTATQQLSDVDNPITRSDLVPVSDFLSIIMSCENQIKAHEGVNPFAELFKLIFAKLFDERTNLLNDRSPAQFRIGVLESPEEARQRIVRLYDRARQRWAGVFLPGDDILLLDESLAFCVSALQKAYLLKSDADVLGAAFEIMVNPQMKGDKGQYFTPRHVIRMCIDVLQPRDQETVFDPGCGSGGFLIGAMNHVFRQIEANRDDENEVLENKKNYASECVFGIDFDTLIAKVAKTYMLIWGDGRANICVGDSLNEDSWDAETKAKYTLAGGRASGLRTFDVIATNPPFAGDIKSDSTLSKYEIAYKDNGHGGRRRRNKVSRDRLFLERCLKMLAPYGRMAIVLPRGLLKNYTDEPVRRFVLSQARIVAVVSLTGQMFKPFTNTKTCVLFLQKRPERLRDVAEAVNDPDTVYAVVERPGKDRSGRIVTDDTGSVLSDLPEIAAALRERAVFRLAPDSDGAI